MPDEFLVSAVGRRDVLHGSGHGLEIDLPDYLTDRYSERNAQDCKAIDRQIERI